MDILQRFQSTLPRRERLEYFIMCYLLLQFQSTLPRRERHYRIFLCSFLPYFNPRSREGSDIFSTSNQCRCFNFNPRSHEGSDSAFSKSFNSSRNFNPRSHEGSDSNFIQFYILYFSISINLYQYFPSHFLFLTISL